MGKIGIQDEITNFLKDTEEIRRIEKANKALHLLIDGCHYLDPLSIYEQIEKLKRTDDGRSES